MGDSEAPISPLATEAAPKITPCSPYVEDETDEEFRPETPPSGIDRDERICRICFSGPEEIDSQGKLISPCKCRYVPYVPDYSELDSGTMKWIHVECLNQWRRASKKESRYLQLVSVAKDSFFRCDECRHEYSFRINSAYLLTTRRTSACRRELTCSHPNRANSNDIHGDGIHSRHADQTSLVSDQDPNLNPPSNDFPPGGSKCCSNCVVCS